MMPLMQMIEKVILQHQEGAITYMEMMSRIVAVMPPPCDEPDVDDVYKYLIRGLVDSSEAERKDLERLYKESKEEQPR